MKEASVLWAEFKALQIERNKNNKVFEAWIQALNLNLVEKNKKSFVFSLEVPSDLHKKWAISKLEAELLSKLRATLEKPCFLEFHVTESLPFSSVDLELKTEENQKNLSKRIFFNPDYTFESFVVGKHNEFAHGASFAISQTEKPSYNPLFIFGPSGLGKTHLLNAIGWEILKTRPKAKVFYLSAERFLNEYIQAIKKKQMNQFRKKYRETCDVLLLDDFQMIAKGSGIQEEFFHTFNDLYERNAQVVACCDQPPSQIHGLEQRIQTRLEAGVMVDVFYPDMETRMAILQYKSDKKNLQIPESLKMEILKSCKRSIRELEGVLNKIKMMNELQGTPISKELIDQVLKSISPLELNIEGIQKTVAEKFKVSILELKSPCRTKNIVTARQVAMYLIKKHLKKSLTDIGRAFSGRDHTTVLNSLKKVEKLKQENPDFKRILEDLHREIHLCEK